MRWLIVFMLGSYAWAVPPPILLDKDTIEVTTNFNGTNIGLTSFLQTDDINLDMIVVGPPATLTFRKKARRAGMWINAEKQTLIQAASYAAFIGMDKGDLQRACETNTLVDLSHDQAASLAWVCNPDQRDLMAAKGLFVLDERKGIMNLGQGFYRTEAFLPPTAKPGSYTVKFWADGKSAQSVVEVKRTGLERLVLTTARNNRLIYGILCLVFAALAGYLTNLIFTKRV